MENGHVITGLPGKRQSIADKLEAAQNKVCLLVQAIDAVDVTVKLFQPDTEIGIVRVRPTPRWHTAFRGREQLYDPEHAPGGQRADDDTGYRAGGHGGA